MAVQHQEVTDSLKLQKLIARLREAADTLEADEPLLDSSKVNALNAQMEVLVNRLNQSEKEALTVSKSDYLRARGPWLEAWNFNAAQMERSVLFALGLNALPKGISKDTMSDRLHLLSVLLAARGLDTVLELSKAQPIATLGYQDYGIAIDRKANQALLLWGQMPQDEFLQKMTTFDEQTIRCSAKAVGLSGTKWNTTARRELHRRAVRFARNTML